MNPKLEALFDEADKGYLKPDDINALSQFVSSLPARLSIYRQLRDEEVTFMQAIADSLQQKFPQESEEKLKRSLQNGILMVRYAAMAMLTDDSDLVVKRLGSWLPDIVEAYDTQAIDEALYQLIKQRLAERFTAQQLALITPGLDTAERLIVSQSASNQEDDELTSETLVSLF